MAGPGAAFATLRRAAGALEDRLLRRLRRRAEKLERGRGRPFGQAAAISFLGASILYGLIGGGHGGTLANAMLAAAGLGVNRIDIGGEAETSELAILEALDVRGAALPLYDAAAAKARVAALPWIAEVSVRKLYPNTLAVAVRENAPVALWQHGGAIRLIAGDGEPIVGYGDPRHADLPLVVGRGANAGASAFLAGLRAHERVAGRVRAAVLVAERRWNLILDNGVTVKLPEHGAPAALARLESLEAESGILSRDVTEIDLRLPDRVSLRLSDKAAEARRKAAETAARRAAGRRA